MRFIDCSSPRAAPNAGSAGELVNCNLEERTLEGRGLRRCEAPGFLRAQLRAAPHGDEQGRAEEIVQVRREHWSYHGKRSVARAEEWAAPEARAGRRSLVTAKCHWP